MRSPAEFWTECCNDVHTDEAFSTFALKSPCLAHTLRPLFESRNIEGAPIHSQHEAPSGHDHSMSIEYASAPTLDAMAIDGGE